MRKNRSLKKTDNATIFNRENYKSKVFNVFYHRAEKLKQKTRNCG